jgi:hypothetical protein
MLKRVPDVPSERVSPTWRMLDCSSVAPLVAAATTTAVAVEDAYWDRPAASSCCCAGFEQAVQRITMIDVWRPMFDGRHDNSAADMDGMGFHMWSGLMR